MICRTRSTVTKDKVIEPNYIDPAAVYLRMAGKRGKGPVKRGSDFPFGVLSVILGVIVILLAILFTFSKPGRGQDDVDGPDLPPSVDLKEYERIVKAAEENAGLGPFGQTQAKELYQQVCPFLSHVC